MSEIVKILTNALENNLCLDDGLCEVTRGASSEERELMYDAFMTWPEWSDGLGYPIKSGYKDYSRIDMYYAVKNGSVCRQTEFGADWVEETPPQTAMDDYRAARIRLAKHIVTELSK